MRVIDLGRYVVFDEIAAGGMSSVHFGRMIGPAGFGRTVAIKRLHPQYAKDPDFVSMMIDEAHLVSRIHHPNVVPTLDVVHTAADLCLVLEYVPGETLARLQALAQQHGTVIPQSVTLAIMNNLLLGLDAAHEARSEEGAPLGIIHRDVSPQNVLVGTDGTARVLDFGIARAASASHRSDGGQLKGKIAYMSPEQLRLDRELGRATDIYAASVVLWELLTGRRMFDRVERSQVAALVLAGGIRSPRAVSPSISEHLEEVVMRGLESLPEQRFATAREMAACLEACGRQANAREVAEFVTSIAAASLAERAQVVSRIERETASRVDVRALAHQIAEGNDAASRPALPAESSTTSAVASARSTTGAPGRRRRRALVWVTAALCALGGGVIVRQLAHARGTARPAVSMPAPPAPDPTLLSAPPLPPSPPSPSPSVVPAAPPATGQPVEPRIRRPQVGARPRPAPSARPSSTPGNDLFDRN